MNWIIEKLPAWNSWIALLLYWLPLALCAYGYTVRSFQRIAKDRQRREDALTHKHSYSCYLPDITVGTLIGYVILSVAPVANLFAAIFDVAPKVFGSFIDMLGRVFDIPLVPKRDTEKTP